ncbi:MAG: carbon-nitrogen hydrolase family protein [Flammeovirgaceae bacterium]|nr:carbon-nitrogen hydrolase family protein [Flammeovirgaceae bacterium]
MKDVRVALVQDAPILFNLNHTIEKVDHLIQQAKSKGAAMVVFPEAFISAYPRGISFGTVVGARSSQGRAMWQRYHDSALDLSSPAFDRLSKIIKKHGIYCFIGVIERVQSGTLYCTLLYFDPKGKCIGKHRKIKPTAAERIIWGEGSGTDLITYDTTYGKVGGLICWENYMPLARLTLFQQSIEIYLAPTADHRDSWQHTIRHIACEGRCYVLSCNQFVTKRDYPTDLPGEDLSGFDEIMSRGGTTVIDPLGNELIQPLWDQPGIIMADLLSDVLVQSKMDFDVVGHYARNDLFR